MITCTVCGKDLRANLGAIFQVLDGWVGVCCKQCQNVLEARVRRLLADVSMEFAAEREWAKQQKALPGS